MMEQDASDKVGMANKTLWYYWKEILACRQLGYDFNEKKDENAGDLNMFLREKMNPEPTLVNESDLLH